jgi:Flp pilus assembly protein TadD
LLWSDLLRSRWHHAGGYLGLLAAAAWFVSLPQREIGLWSLDFYKAGIRATDLGEYKIAQQNLQVAHAYAPDSADINFALGNIGLAEGNHVEAKRYYRRALQLKPNHEGVLNNIGVIAIKEKHYSFAEQCFLRALTVEPDDAKMLYLLAMARLEGGNPEGARAPLARALKIRPTQEEFLALAQRLPQSN